MCTNNKKCLERPFYQLVSWCRLQQQSRSEMVIPNFRHCQNCIAGYFCWWIVTTFIPRAITMIPPLKTPKDVLCVAGLQALWCPSECWAQVLQIWLQSVFTMVSPDRKTEVGNNPNWDSRDGQKLDFINRLHMEINVLLDRNNMKYFDHLCSDSCLNKYKGEKQCPMELEY